MRNKSKTKLSRLTISIILVLSAVALIQIYTINVNIDNARTEQLELTQQLKELQSSNAALKAQIQSADDPKTKENIARSRLGFVLPGEIIYKEN